MRIISLRTYPSTIEHSIVQMKAPTWLQSFLDHPLEDMSFDPDMLEKR